MQLKYFCNIAGYLNDDAFSGSDIIEFVSSIFQKNYFQVLNIFLFLITSKNLKVI